VLFVFLPMQELQIAGKRMDEEWYEERYETRDPQERIEQEGSHD
jgi:hypothetical protein